LGELRILMGKTRSRASDALEEAPARLEERGAVALPDVLPRFPAQEPQSAPTDFGSLPSLPDLGSVVVHDAPAPAEPEALAPDISFDLASSPAAAEEVVPAAPAVPE